MGRHRKYKDDAARQRAYRKRKRRKRQQRKYRLRVKERSRSKSMNEMVAAICYKHSDDRGMFIKRAPVGMGKLIYMGGNGAQDDIADISDRLQVKRMIGGTRVTPEGFGHDDNREGHTFKVALAEPSYKPKDRSLGVDHKIALMTDRQVYWSMRSPLEERLLTLQWLAERGMRISMPELQAKWGKAEKTKSPGPVPLPIRETSVDQLPTQDVMDSLPVAAWSNSMIPAERCSPVLAVISSFQLAKQISQSWKNSVMRKLPATCRNAGRRLQDVA